MKSLRFAVLAVSILLPLSAFAQELSEERVKEGSGQNMGVMRRVFCLRRSADHRELRPL
ncbi:hypothetical protein RA2_02655 [Roseovarius sp. A-2]|nr:hypothetical protein RA2_02655 [Roseovarius sp. A-2]